MRIAFAFTLLIVVTGCRHLDVTVAPADDVTPLLHRSAATTLRTLDDARLGLYRGAYGVTSDFMLTRVDDHLVLTSTTNKASSLNVPLYLRDDGVFAVPGHSGAWFSKRDGKTFLTVAYCSMFAVYELVPT